MPTEVSPEEVAVAPGAGVGRPRVVEPVALDLERAAGAAELVAHLLEKPLERRLLYLLQLAPDPVPCIMVTAETEYISIKWNIEEY